MLFVLIYSLSIVLWVAAYIATERMGAFHSIGKAHVRLLRHFLQAVLLCSVASYDFAIRPILRNYYAQIGIEIHSGACLLLYTVPGGTVFAAVALSVYIDCARRYFCSVRCDLAVCESFVFWSGLAFAVVVLLAAHPALMIDISLS